MQTSSKPVINGGKNDNFKKKIPFNQVEVFTATFGYQYDIKKIGFLCIRNKFRKSTIPISVHISTPFGICQLWLTIFPIKKSIS